MIRYIVLTYFLTDGRSSKNVSVGLSFALTPTAKRTSGTQQKVAAINGSIGVQFVIQCHTHKQHPC